MTTTDPEQQVLMARRWRTGRRNGRVLYAVMGPEPSDDDIMIGSMDSARIAVLVVNDHNHAILSDLVDRAELVDRDALAEFLRDNVQTLDKGEDYYLADRLIGWWPR